MASLRELSLELEFRYRLDGSALATLTGLQALSITELLDLDRSQVQHMGGMAQRKWLLQISWRPYALNLSTCVLDFDTLRTPPENAWPCRPYPLLRSWITTPLVMRQVPSALPSLRRLTRLAYSNGACYPTGPPNWEHELLASTASLTALRSLEVVSGPIYGGEVAGPHKPSDSVAIPLHCQPPMRVHSLAGRAWQN